MEWIDEQPGSQERIFKVHVTVLEEVSGSERKSQGAKMVEALKKLAEIADASSINDPVAWQRETRRDRVLFEGLE
ncbi:hypothetical protein [Oscillatoria sp. FACHB-1406]|uniref:hypothetical protein n=1 Tax=Oscillatoria sp. FACHB-1406 TaxID=2692846 RepID=UPI0018F056F2|nr:hypothetical protein [Oscillatoria sp. FACHB-1406]